MSNLNDHAYSQGWWRWETDDLKDVTWWWQVMRYRGAKSYQHPSVTGQWSGMLPWQQSHKAGSRLQTGQDRMMGMERYLMLHVTAQNRHTHTPTHTHTQMYAETNMLYDRRRWQTYVKEWIHYFSTQEILSFMWHYNKKLSLCRCVLIMMKSIGKNILLCVYRLHFYIYRFWQRSSWDKWWILREGLRVSESRTTHSSPHACPARSHVERFSKCSLPFSDL